MDKAMRPKPKYREMDIANPNKPPDPIVILGEDGGHAANVYTLD